VNLESTYDAVALVVSKTQADNVEHGGEGMVEADLNPRAWRNAGGVRNRTDRRDPRWFPIGRPDPERGDQRNQAQNQDKHNQRGRLGPAAELAFDCDLPVFDEFLLTKGQSARNLHVD